MLCKATFGSRKLLKKKNMIIFRATAQKQEIAGNLCVPYEPRELLGLVSNTFFVYSRPGLIYIFEESLRKVVKVFKGAAAVSTDYRERVTGSYRLQREILTLCLTSPAQERPCGEFVVVEQAHDHHDHHSHHDDYDHDLHKLQFSCNI